MNIEGSIAFVTGANRGLGRRFAEQLVQRGAARVYAAARDPQRIDVPGVVPVPVDLTDPESIARAPEQARDVTLLVNNAGINTHTPLIDPNLDNIRLEMETNYFGTLAMVRAFAPVIAENGGGAVLNVLSVLSWRNVASSGAYSASKAAAWSMTNALRLELAPNDIAVTALHMGFLDTDMAAHVPAELRSDPALVAAAALDGLEAGKTEVLADEVTRTVRAGLAMPAPASATA